MKWVDVNEELPSEDEPVLLYGNGEIQEVTYTFCQSDDGKCYFRPNHFNSDLKVKPKWVTSWCYVRDVPTP